MHRVCQADVIFLGMVGPRSPLNEVANGGLLALGVYLLVLAAGAATLLWRYRWVER